jgi:hypothetical protein
MSPYRQGAVAIRAVAPTPPLELEGFLDWEERQPERLKLAGGVVQMMAGGTEGHDRNGGNIFGALSVRLHWTPWSAHRSNLKLLSRAMGAAMNPDTFVRCGPREGGSTRTDEMVVVFEVLSEGTAQFDLPRKTAGPRGDRAAMPSGLGVDDGGATRCAGPGQGQSLAQQDGRGIRGRAGVAGGHGRPTFGEGL